MFLVAELGMVFHIMPIIHCNKQSIRALKYQINMTTNIRPRRIILAAAMISTTRAFLNNGYSTTTSHNIPSTKLDATRQTFSELDNLKAKRLNIRQQYIPAADLASAKETEDSIDTQDATMTPNDNLVSLEYLYDTAEERHSDDLFHIILLPSTFKSDMSVSVEDAALSTSEILGINYDHAYDMSVFARHQGFSTLGSWTREECLSLGEELLSNGLDCRVIPFNAGGAISTETFPEVMVDIYSHRPEALPVEMTI